MTANGPEIRGDRTSPVTLLHRASRRINAAFRSAWKNHATRRELARCAVDGQLGEVLGDIGLPQSQAAWFVGGSRDGQVLLRTMAWRMGIDLDDIQRPAIRRDMERVCVLCAAHRRCRRWAAGSGADDPRHFCPNVETLALAKPRAAMIITPAPPPA